MSYLSDPVFQTVQWLRGRASDSESLRNAFSVVWRDWAQQASLDVQLRLDFVNYKPFERARIVARTTVRTRDDRSISKSLDLFFHVFADPQDVEAEFKEAGWRSSASPGPSPLFCLPSRGLVVWSLPNAPGLRQLSHVLDPDGFRSLLSAAMAPAIDLSDCAVPALIRYVPLHRALLTWAAPGEGRRFYIKTIACGMKSAAAALNLRELHARGEHGEFSFSVPRLVRYSPDLQTLVMTEVPGRRFTEVIGESLLTAFGELGVALAELHAVPAVPTDTWSVEKELSDLRRHMAGVQRALPHLSQRLDAVLAGLEKRSGNLPDVPFAPLHGNLFGDQILYDDTSESPVGIVDWDGWCYGDPHYDLGRLIAHVLYVAKTRQLSVRATNGCIATLLAGYERTASRDVHWPWLEWHVAAALLLRVKISSLRPLVRAWPAHFEFAVSEVEAYLDGKSTSAGWRRSNPSTVAGSIA